MFRRYLQRLRNFQRTLLMLLGGRRQEISRIKADADAALTEFNTRTVRLCLDHACKQRVKI